MIRRCASSISALERHPEQIGIDWRRKRIRGSRKTGMVHSNLYREVFIMDCRDIRSGKPSHRHARKLIYQSLNDGLWQSTEYVLHLRVDWSTHTRHRIPARCGREALGPTTWIRAMSDVVEHLRMLVDRRIEETDRALALRQSLLVDERDD